ncbi:Nn.00g105260.m01.CDS01 [Neocucurbitaria sp. VM-36]
MPFHSSLPLYHDYEPTPHYHNYDDERRTPDFEQAPQFSSTYERINLGNTPPTGRPASTSALHRNTSGLHLPQVENMASSAPRRFAGDGLDYRRPVSSAREPSAATVDLTREEEAIDLSRDEDVIDLTADDSGYGASQDGNTAASHGNDAERLLEQRIRSRRANNGAPRLPRGMDIIIDLDNGEEQWRLASPSAVEPASPEIEYISSRRIDQPRREPPTFGRSNSEGDEVEFVRENALPQEEAQRRRDQEIDNVMDLLGTMNGRFTHLRAQVDRFNAQVNRTADRFRRVPVAPPRGLPRAHAHAHVRFMAPTLDFEMVGFDIAMPGVRAQEPPPPTYEAPDKAPEGFTRSPGENDVLVCPNCGDELCVGDDEVKRQVWIAKGCGHVYCGECTTNRSVKRSAKGKEKPTRTKPFKDCQVEGCGKNVANRKSMIQIFL